MSGADAEAVAALKREGEARMAAGQVEEARKQFSEALRLAPRDVDARDGLVRCAIAMGDAAVIAGDRDRAVSHYQMALELSPFHPQADAGLRRAAALEDKRSDGDPIGAVLEAFPPVRAMRDLQTADRIVGKMSGTAPSKVLKDTMDSRREGLAAQGVRPRALRMEEERAAAWRRRWLYRSIPAAAVGVAVVLWMATGSILVLNWGLLLGIFAAVWDVAFVERGEAAAKRLDAAQDTR